MTMLATMTAFALATAAAVTPPPPSAPPAQPVQVMVLGAYHFANPGRDIVNVKVDDVTTPRRQEELAALADALVAFRPTRVMVEERASGPTLDVADYAAFRPATLARDRDETIQIGYRVAARAGLKSVQGIDENGGPGEPDFFPIDTVQAWARAHGRAAEFDGIFAAVQAQAKAIEAIQLVTSVPALLLRYNDPASPVADQSSYYAMLRLGDAEAQPGADLNAMWYMRNARIFAKLMSVVRPGDRVLVVYGAGHGYWLRHFAATAPGYGLVDVRPYLERAAAAVTLRPAR